MLRSLLGELDFASSSNETGSSGSNKTTLLTTGGISTGSSWVTNVLMVTTTVRMLNGVHGNTSNSGPVLLLCLPLEVGVVSSEEGLITSLATGDDTDHSSASSKDGLSNAGWESDSSLSGVFRMSDDNTGGSGSTGEGSSVSEFGFAR